MQQLCHPGAFFGQKTTVLLVAAPVFEVDLLVRNVDVATQDEVALGFQAHEVGVEFGQKAEFGLLALFAGRAARKVRTDDRQLAGGRVKTQLDISAFCIELGRPIANDYIRRLVPRVDAHARIALFLGKVKVSLQVREALEPVGHVGRLSLHFLHANTIRPRGCHPAFHAFAGGRADAIEIEAG